MRRMRSERLAFLLTGSLAIACHGAPDGRTRAMNESAAIELPADFYPILPWGKGPAPERAPDPAQGLPSMAECGFTLAGFAKPEIPPLCEKHGLKAIVHPGSVGIGRNEWRSLSGEEIDRRVKHMVATIGDSPALLGYYLIDEPGASLLLNPERPDGEEVAHDQP